MHSSSSSSSSSSSYISFISISKPRDSSSPLSLFPFIQYSMENEIKNLINVWILAIALISYSYFIASRFQKGFPRLIILFPVFFIFTILPLNLHSFHFCSTTGLLLTWLANFKLLLFAFDIDSFSSPLPTLFQFISIVSLPIKIKNNYTKKLPPQKHDIHPFFLFSLKILLMNIVVRLYDYRHFLRPNLVTVLYCVNLYLGEEIILAICSIPARVFIGASFHKQFNDPYLSTSLQDFWGRRWNLMVPNILRPTVYNPTRNMTSPIIGPVWAQRLAMVVAFSTSGLVHELLYYYLTRVSPTWEVTWFFVLHGICTAAEVAVKEAAAAKKVWLHPMISGMLTLGFLMLTSKWLLLPQIIRNGVVERAIDEYWTIVHFLKAKLLLC